MKKKEEISSLVKMLMTLSKKLTLEEYNNSVSTLYQLMNGVTFGFDDTLSPKFLKAAKAIKEQQLHLKKSLKGNVVEFRQIK
jgi:hypothetical protein|tara:strand:- start:437 stop:682 length:246 start_codon:yes stop_codon:yes gene_type:complete